MLRRSKLEVFADILEVLVYNGQLKLTQITRKANVNCSLLKEYLAFLIKQNLVEERTVGKRGVIYAITQKGITVLKYFREVRQALPVSKKSNKMPIPY